MLLATFAIPTQPNIIKNPTKTKILLLIVTDRIIRNGSAGNA
jgi:hypothetical protein